MSEDTDFTTAISHLDTSDDHSAKKQAVLLVLSGQTTGQMVYLETKDLWTLGRSNDNDIIFQDVSISRNHCQIFFQGNDQWIVKDLNSSNGTWVNGTRIQEAALKGNDKIQLGQTLIMKFVLQDELESAFQRELYESATKDALTGLCSKRHFLENLDIEFNYHRRTKKPLSVVLCDLDHFKVINDSHGHVAGDQVLKEIGSLFLNVLRKGDLAGRYGGEEVIFFLRETPLPGAKVFAERIRVIVETHPFIYEGKRIPVTVSLGIATAIQENYKNMTELIKTADDYLYKAKQAGRNRVACMGST